MNAVKFSQKIQMISLEKIKPYELNAKKHPPEQIEKIARQIKEHGWDVPVVLDRDFVVIKGHGRLLAAQYLNLDAAPCIVRDDLTPEQIRLARIADNKVAESEWDFEFLKKDIFGLKLDKIDISLTGFDDFSFLEDLDNKDRGCDQDDIPEASNKIYVGQGDLFELDGSRVLCGDSTKIEEVQRLMDGEKADLVWTDPPYNVDYEQDSTGGTKIQNDHMKEEDFIKFLTDAFVCMHSSMKAGATYYICHSDTWGLQFRLAVKNADLILRQCLVWVKNSMVMGRQDYQWAHEPLLVGWKSGAAHNWYSDRKQTTVLNFDRPRVSAEHPTIKPVELIEYSIHNSSKTGDLVLDLFGGSGSTLIAATKTSRKAYLMELEPKYVAVILNRWCKFTGQEAYRVEKDGSKTAWSRIKELGEESQS